MVKGIVLMVLAVTLGCGSSAHHGADTTADAPVQPVGGDANQCPPPNTTSTDAMLATQYAAYYSVYDLGAPPGVPDPLGGTTILASDPNTLLIAGASETPEAAIYAVSVTRDACHHITGFAGTATMVATTPYVDANLVYANSQLLIYSEWPEYKLAQLAGAATTPSSETDLRTLGIVTSDDNGPGGVGFVPPGLGAAGELRLVTWPAGNWYHAATSPSAGMLTINSLALSVTLPNQPGGFAYVPAGSPGFTTQAVIVAEWGPNDGVSVYDADANGDPVVATRREFFSKFMRPWGAYFEPVTGDYLFLQWGAGVDHVFIVQGFSQPPAIL
jgi:hypothetical protein